MDANTAAAETQDAAPAAEPSMMDRHEDAILAREDASGAASPKKPEPVKPVANEPPKAAKNLAAIATREWNARQKEDAAKALQEKYLPLDQAAEKRDLVGVLNALASRYGFEFKDFVAALTNAEAEAPQKKPEELVATAVADALKKRDEESATQAAERAKQDTDAKIANFRSTAERIAANGGDRWELTDIAGKAGEAWDLIEGHFVATSKFDADGKLVQPGEKLELDQALDLIEGKLREKKAGRVKQEPGKATGGAKATNEAGAKEKAAKAGKPSFTNRSTSGAATVPDDDDDESSDDEAGAITDGDAIARAAKKAGIRL